MVLEDVWQITANPQEADKFDNYEGISTDQWLGTYFELRDEIEFWYDEQLGLYDDDAYSYAPLLGGPMNAASGLLSATVLGLGCMAVSFIFATGCASTRDVGEPAVETVTPPPLVEPAASPPLGPPPGYVKPENYWVREKIILTSAPEPAASATQKSSGKKGKKNTKTGK
jgi:hypothetical protein